MCYKLIADSLSQKKLFNIKDLAAYFLVAGAGVVVQYIAGSFAADYWGLDFESSVSFGYAVSFFVGFALTKYFAFDVRNTQQTRREMVKFVMVATLSGFITVGVSSVAKDVIGSFFRPTIFEIPLSFVPPKMRQININRTLALLVGVGFSFINNFVLHKTFTFRSTGFYDRLKTYLK